MTTLFEFAGRIPSNHPALAGHFPGHPIAPGVVLLNQVAQAFAHWQSGLRITAWPLVKFVSPLLPEEDFVVRLTCTAPGVARFTLHVDVRLVANGQFTFVSGDELNT